MRQWLDNANVPYTTANIKSALDILQALGEVVRPEVPVGVPRPGQLAEHAPEAAGESVKAEPEMSPEAEPRPDQDPLEVRQKLVLRRILQHREGYDSESGLLEWLKADGVKIDAAELAEVLNGLWETGEVIRPPVNAGSPRPGWLGHGRDEEGWLVSASGVRIFLRGGASAPL